MATDGTSCACALAAWCRGRSSCPSISRRSFAIAGADPAAVGLDLGLTGAAGSRCRRPPAGPATGLPGHRLTPAAQPRQQVLQLGQLDLRLALPALGVLGEDVEDQRGPVDDLDLDDVLELAQLAGGQLAVADDGVGAGGDDDVAQLLGLAGADVGRRVGLGRGAGSARRAPAEPAVSASAASSRSEFSASLDGALGPDADQHDALEAQLAVLDLGDVLELGRQPGDAAQRRRSSRSSWSPSKVVKSLSSSCQVSSSARAVALNSKSSDRGVILSLWSHPGVCPQGRTV